MVSVSLPSNRPRCMIRWPSFEGLEGRASRIFAFSWLTVVVAASWGKVNGLVTPVDGDTMTRVKLGGPGCFSRPGGIAVPAGVSVGRDMVVVEQ
jgi:hypothetical protein